MTDDPAGLPEQRLLAALAQHFGDTEFSARAAAADIPRTMWVAVGVGRPDASSCGRWLRAHRGSGLTGKPDRSGVVRWRLRGAAAPSAALQAPVPVNERPSASAGPAGAPARPRASSTPAADRWPAPARAGGPAAGFVALVAPSRHGGRHRLAGAALGMHGLVVA